MKNIIAIDGLLVLRKNTMAKDLAREMGYIYIDSGAMYRAVTLYCLDNGLFTDSGIREEELRNNLPDIRISFRLNPETQRPVTLLNGEGWKNASGPWKFLHVSPVAALGFVREALVKQQQEMGRQERNCDGRTRYRDRGFPDAELKIFVTASADIRARRRYDELKAKGRPASYDEILKNVEERDYIDQNREVGPLRKAEDAILLDNSHMTIAEQKQWLAEQFKKSNQWLM